MTDKEIEKGLECCKKMPMSDCDNCPYEANGCKQELLDDAFDWIVEQKTCVNRLEAEKAVSDRALELACGNVMADIHCDSCPVEKNVCNDGTGCSIKKIKDYLLYQAKRELEKEKK